MSGRAGSRAGQAAAGQVCKDDGSFFVAIFTNNCIFLIVWVLSPQNVSPSHSIIGWVSQRKRNVFLHPRLLLFPLCPHPLLLLQFPLRSSTRPSLVKRTSGYNSMETAKRVAELQTDPEWSVRSALCEVLPNISGMLFTLVPRPTLEVKPRPGRKPRQPAPRLCSSVAEGFAYCIHSLRLPLAASSLPPPS